MGRERKRVEETCPGRGGANLNHTLAGDREIIQITLGIKEGGRFGAAPGSSRHEDRPELRFKIPFYLLASVYERAEDGGGSTRENALIRHKNELLKLLWRLRTGHEVVFGRERDTLEVVQRADRVGREAMLAKQGAVIGRERQNRGTQIMRQPFSLCAANDPFRQVLPPIPEQVRIHV